MSRFITLSIALGLIALAGCMKQQSELSGTVTFKGRPVPSGEIVLTPDESRGNRGPGVLVMIQDGKFRTPAQRGHWGGAYLATITGYKGTDALFSDYAMSIDLPENDSTYDFVVPDQAAK